MNYPMEAFEYINITDAPAGALLLFMDTWAVRLDDDGQDNPQILLLTGHAAGALAKADAVQALHVVEPYGWQIYADTLWGDPNYETRPAVSFGQGNPLIHGHSWGHPHESLAVDVSGKRVVTQGLAPFIGDFSVWLVNGLNEQVGTKSLFDVRSPAR